MSDCTEPQQMLCVAALAYRDFVDVRPPAAHEERLRQDIAAQIP